MTFRYTAIGVFRCDVEHCPEKILGYLEETPTGWTVVEPKERDGMVKHFCPKHAALAVAESALHTSGK